MGQLDIVFASAGIRGDIQTRVLNRSEDWGSASITASRS